MWLPALRLLRRKNAQVLLPAVLLAPVFILVIYLLFETAKVSMTKVRQQFALDNAAYAQMSSASTYLNSLAMVNGPLPYRVLQYYAGEQSTLNPTSKASGTISVFELFYQGGGVPSIGPDYSGKVKNPPPPAKSTDWGLRYYDGTDMEFPRKDWEKENPSVPGAEESVPVMSKDLVANYYFPAKGLAVPVISQYLETYARVGSIYKSQDYVYQEVSKNAIMFREAYFLNVNDCKRSECARQSAAQLRPWLRLVSKPFELSKVKFYISDTSSLKGGAHGGAYDVEFVATEIFNGEKLFQFAFLDPSSRSKLYPLSRGIRLKQSFKLPRNHFNIDLAQKYKPYVRNRVVLSCPRNNNNCVWPNPLPKYNVLIKP